MNPDSRAPEQDDFLRLAPGYTIGARHELVPFAILTEDWVVFDRKWAGLLSSAAGQTATPPCLIARWMYLRHAFKLSDEAAAARRVENHYCQPFTGETFFQHRQPTAPPSGALAQADR